MGKIMNLETDNNIKTGKVLWYSFDKGYGWIQSDGKDWFFHASCLTDNFRLPKTDDIVRFKPGTRKGRGITLDVTKIQ